MESLGGPFTLAAGCLGDAHALDDAQPVATLVKRALVADDQTLSSDALWAAAGVLVGGGISCTVLVLNLHADGDSATASIIKTAADTGEPLHLKGTHSGRCTRSSKTEPR